METRQPTQVVTFGCRLNAFESEVMRQNAEDAGLRDAIIVNTCTVTGEATRQARQAIRRLRRENPAAKIVVTGCAAQIDPSTFSAMPEVDGVLGNTEKMNPDSLLPDNLFGEDAKTVAVADIMAVREGASHLIGGFEGRARAFVEIQQGCDHRCTFCIIPFARGPNRSVPAGAIVEQVRRLVDAGYLELVLTGVDICSYGHDLPGRPSLGGLVRRILRMVPGLPRLRLSTVDPAAVDSDLIAALAEEKRLMPHLHLSLQAGDDMVLKRMRRRHVLADAMAVCQRVRDARPDVVFGADIIAGFPTETEAMFSNGLRSIDDLGLTHLHIFPYSPRPGTPAMRMPQVSSPVRRERAARLRAAGDAALGRFLAGRVGRTVPVLIEDSGRGRCPHYTTIHVVGATDHGSIVDVIVTDLRDGRLEGRLAE